MTPDIPLKRLDYFRKEIGLDESKPAALRPYARHLAAKSGKAGKYLDALFRKVAPRTSMELALSFPNDAVRRFWTDCTPPSGPAPGTTISCATSGPREQTPPAWAWTCST